MVFIKSKLRLFTLLFGLSLANASVVKAQEEELLPPNLPKLVVKTVLVSSNEDKAGIWSVFGAGKGNIHGAPDDWHLRIRFLARRPINIKSITFLHNQAGYPDEGWSTSSEKYYSKQLYPIVVFNKAGAQINTAYDQSLGQFGSGIHTLDLFAQTENPDFGGGKLIIKDAAGAVYNFNVRARLRGSCQKTDPGVVDMIDELHDGEDDLVDFELKNGRLLTDNFNLRRQIRNLRRAR